MTKSELLKAVLKKTKGKGVVVYHSVKRKIGGKKEPCFSEELTLKITGKRVQKRVKGLLKSQDFKKAEDGKMIKVLKITKRSSNRKSYRFNHYRTCCH